MRYKAPRGTQDVLPGDSERWQWLERTFREVCSLYGYQEIRTPIFEQTELFQRGLGEATEVVTKEMYTFEDRGGRSLTLKPEGTAPAIRAYLENHLGDPGQITRLYYITPIFRYERPQAGRYRQAHQTGLELIGSSAPEADAEVIDITLRWYRALGVRNLALKVNTLGMRECRFKYREALLDYARSWLDDLSPEERARFQANPLRMLDSKDPRVQEAMADAPTLEAYLEPESQGHFDRLLELLAALGIAFEVDRRLVRGLDYYTKTVFEVQSPDLGAQNALCGGGRYDNLIEEVGGPPTPATGVAMGIERALLALEAAGALPARSAPADAFVIVLTDSPVAQAWLAEWRDGGLRLLSDPERRSARSQFRQADRSGAPFAVTIGDEELGREVARVKDLQTGEERELPKAAVPDAIRSALRDGKKAEGAAGAAPSEGQEVR
jgi:histidyl-tRNA synthetase